MNITNKDLTDQTFGEQLWLWRRREGFKQTTAAARLGMGRTTYWKHETDQVEFELPRWWRDPPQTVGELCALARRRTGWSLRKTAAKVGVSHVILLRREACGHLDLRAFWEARGFQFS
jgi:transcriptional regulator with XRE-family HTH domain